MEIRVICHNIRHAEELLPGEAPWSERLPLLMSHLKYHVRQVPNAVIALQEPLHGQLADIMASMGSEWAFVGVGREDGEQAGEYSPILFKPAVFECVEWETVWLSPEPRKRGWDASAIRIMTVAHLRHRPTGREFLLGNAHFDDQGIIARREAAKIMVSVLEQWSQTRGNQAVPLLAMGDLNSTPDRDSYQILSQHFADVKAMCDPSAMYGEEITYTDFPVNPNDPPEILDHIFIGPRSRLCWVVEGYAVLPHSFDASKTLHSDHRAVVADLRLS